MSKPNDFRETCVLAMDVPYQNASKTGDAPYASDGILRQGRVVWVKEHAPDYASAVNIAAYAEGVGVIEVPQNALQGSRLASLRR